MKINNIKDIGILGYTVLIYIYTLIFWYLFFVQLSHGVLEIPMGLGGAMYPIFFSVPVILGTFIYEAAIKNIISKDINNSKRITYAFIVPSFIVSILLIVFCPMDSDSTYIGFIIKKL